VHTNSDYDYTVLVAIIHCLV